LTEEEEGDGASICVFVCVASGVGGESKSRGEQNTYLPTITRYYYYYYHHHHHHCH